MNNPVAPAVREYIEIGAGYVVATRGGGSTFRIHGPDKRYAIVSSEYDHPFYTQMAKAIAAERAAASGELERLRAALKAAEDKQCASCRHCDSFGLRTALEGDDK